MAHNCTPPVCGSILMCRHPNPAPDHGSLVRTRRGACARYCSWRSSRSALATAGSINALSAARDRPVALRLVVLEREHRHAHRPAASCRSGSAAADRADLELLDAERDRRVDDVDAIDDTRVPRAAPRPPRRFGVSSVVVDQRARRGRVELGGIDPLRIARRCCRARGGRSAAACGASWARRPARRACTSRTAAGTGASFTMRSASARNLAGSASRRMTTRAAARDSRRARAAYALMIVPTSSPLSAASTWPGLSPFTIWSSLHHRARGRYSTTLRSTTTSARLRSISSLRGDARDVRRTRSSSSDRRCRARLRP